MNPWKYRAIGHERHVVCNPLSEAKIDEVVELLALSDQGRVLDIGCGKGEFLVRTATRWRCRAVGIDISPYFVADARARVKSANLEPSIEIAEGNGSQYETKPSSFDATVCLGASWIWGGFEGTLRALSAWTRPGGLIVVGEPFWRRPPSPAYLEAAKLSPATFSTHIGNVQVGIGLGLGLLHAVVSSDDDWDRYEGYQWYAAEQYASRYPEDPDVPELTARMREARDQFLRWGRDEMGWAVYLFSRNPAA